MKLTKDELRGLLLSLECLEAAWRAADIVFQAPWSIQETRKKLAEEYARLHRLEAKRKAKKRG